MAACTTSYSSHVCHYKISCLRYDPFSLLSINVFFVDAKHCTSTEKHLLFRGVQVRFSGSTGHWCYSTMCRAAHSTLHHQKIKNSTTRVKNSTKVLLCYAWTPLLFLSTLCFDHDHEKLWQKLLQLFANFLRHESEIIQLFKFPTTIQASLLFYTLL